MNYFDTAAGQNTMENISHQLARIADAMEALAEAWGKMPESKTAAEEAYHRLADQI